MARRRKACLFVAALALPFSQPFLATRGAMPGAQKGTTSLQALEPVFELCLGGMRLSGNRFEKLSEPPEFTTAVGKAAHSSGRHYWRLQRIAGSGFRTRLGICAGNITDSDPALSDSSSSAWYYEDVSGSLFARLGQSKSVAVATEMPSETYVGDEIAVILDCNLSAVYFFWPSGAQGVIKNLPADSFRIFISTDTIGDAWEVSEEDLTGQDTETSVKLSKFLGTAGDAVTNVDVNMGLALDKAIELNENYNITSRTQDALSELLTATGNLAGQAASKAMEANEKYKLTDQIKAKLEEQFKSK